MVEKKKGIVYIVEAVIAILILLVFVVGNAVPEPSQDWSEFQDEVSATDLTYTLKKTGDLEKMIQRRETGSLKTSADVLTEGQLEVSGTVQNLPLNSVQIGFHAPESEVHEGLEMKIVDEDNDPECHDDLDEIEERKEDGSEIKRSTDEDSKHDTVLYFADIDPNAVDDTEGFDYGMWVDRHGDSNNRCQFADEDGPFFNDEIFKWGTSPENYYELKEINFDSDNFRTHNATQAVRIKEILEKPLNGIETSQEVETFDYSEKNIHEYDLVVLRNSSIEEGLSNTEISETDEFLEGNPVLVLADLDETDLDNGFLDGKGLEWVELDTHNDGESQPVFGSDSDSEELKSYFKGLEGDTDDIGIEAQGKISSANSDTIMESDKIFYDNNLEYNISQWNVSNSGMEEVEEDEYEEMSSLPDTACYDSNNLPDESLTFGEFTFEETDTVNVTSTEMGSEESDCDDIRALNIDLDGNNDFGDEGPLLPGENIEIGGRNYNVRAESSEEAEFVFLEDDNVEIVNYRESFEDIDGGERLARLPYNETYNKDDRKLISSVIYWLVRDNLEFGDEDSSISTSLVGSISENTYMPYKTNLRWD